MPAPFCVLCPIARHVGGDGLSGQIEGGYDKHAPDRADVSHGNDAWAATVEARPIAQEAPRFTALRVPAPSW